MQELNLVVTESGEACGAIVMWSLDGSVAYDALAASWSNSGLNAQDCPEQPSPRATLRSVMGAFAKRNRIVRPVGEGQLGLVEELVVDRSAKIENGEEPLEHRTLAVARILADESVEVSAKDADLAKDIVESYTTARNFVGVTEFSMWLTTMVQSRFSGVPLRPRGGVYFVPKSHLADLQALASVIETNSNHKLYRISALRTSEAVEAILDAVVREAEELVTDISEDIETSKINKRGGKTRKEALESMQKKLSDYEKLLNSRREDMHSKLEQTEANLAVAILAE